MGRHKKLEQGIYALILHCAQGEAIFIGALRDVYFSPGFYVYVGSAHGPGGVFARVRRHLASDKRMHWHIDYLTASLQIVEVWYSHAEKYCEHEWVEAVQEIPGVRPAVRGFGSSDCSCITHLFHLGCEPDVDNFLQLVHKRGCLGEGLVVEQYQARYS